MEVSSAVRRLQPISAKRLHPLLLRRPAPLRCLRPYLPSATENQDRSHGEGAAQQELLAATLSGPSPWPQASPDTDRLYLSTSVLP